MQPSPGRVNRPPFQPLEVETRRDPARAATGINYSASGVAVGQHDMVGTDYYQWDPRGKLDPGTIRSIPGNTGLLSVGTGHALENHPVVQGVPDSGNIKGYRASISPPLTCEEKTVNHTGRQSYVPGGKAKRIVAYDGKSSCQDYLVQFDLVAEMNDWNGVARAMELATSLSGVARSVLSDIDINDRRNYDKLVAVLLTRFEPENQSEVYRAQLKGRLRKRSEPLTELTQDVWKLARKAYPTAATICSTRRLRRRKRYNNMVNFSCDFG